MFAQFRNRTIAAVAIVAFTTVLAAPATTHAAPPGSTSVTVPVVGTVATGGTFTGTMTLTSFAVQNGQTVANALVTGVVTTAAGATSVVSTVTAPINTAATTATCQILHLDIGPIALNLLGLNVNLSEVVLDITAVQGAGNLLGNLLCAVAGLLDSPGGLSRVLNQILGVLQGL